MEGKASEALAEFDAAIAAEPKLPQLHLNRSIALIRLGRLGEAAAALEAIAALEAAPELLASAAYHRALVADRSGDLETAS
ncbi:MAG TPA: tetratricopeptide repeat protein, partial [Thermoanaerobaculia bacterium]|nr:tetratricopeptide repeat protein [Thermoanaerobaculia bacterium]